MEATVGRSLAKTRLRRRRETRQTLVTRARPYAREAREQLTVRDGRTVDDRETRLGNGGNGGNGAPLGASLAIERSDRELSRSARNSNIVAARDTEQKITLLPRNTYERN